jgi:hypothetical protein
VGFGLIGGEADGSQGVAMAEFSEADFFFWIARVGHEVAVLPSDAQQDGHVIGVGLFGWQVAREGLGGLEVLIKDRGLLHEGVDGFIGMKGAR